VEGAQRSQVRLAGHPHRGEGAWRRGPKRWWRTRAYDSGASRGRLRARGISLPVSRRRNARPRPGRRPELRGLPGGVEVETTFAWLGDFGRLVVRWGRYPHLYLALLLIACFVILLRAISG
jgi:hypothetical protein